MKMRKLVYKKYKTRVTSVRSRNTRQQLQAVASSQTRSSNKERRKEGQSLPPPPPSASYQIECSAIFPPTCFTSIYVAFFLLFYSLFCFVFIRFVFNCLFGHFLAMAKNFSFSLVFGPEPATKLHHFQGVQQTEKAEEGTRHGRQPQSGASLSLSRALFAAVYLTDTINGRNRQQATVLCPDWVHYGTGCLMHCFFCCSWSCLFSSSFTFTCLRTRFTGPRQRSRHRHRRRVLCISSLHMFS